MTYYPSWNDILKASSNVIEETKGTKIEPYHLAEKYRSEAIARDDQATAQLWRDVWVFLMAKRYQLQERKLLRTVA